MARERVRVAIAFDPAERRTKQSMKDECNINNIMAKYIRTRTISHFNKHSATYGFAPATEFREALETVRVAEAMFMELPAAVRKRFQNDPAEFLNFVQDEKNAKEMEALGLTNKAPETPPADSATPPKPEG